MKGSQIFLYHSFLPGQRSLLIFYEEGEIFYVYVLPVLYQMSSATFIIINES